MEDFDRERRNVERATEREVLCFHIRTLCLVEEPVILGEALLYTLRAAFRLLHGGSSRESAESLIQGIPIAWTAEERESVCQLVKALRAEDKYTEACQIYAQPTVAHGLLLKLGVSLVPQNLDNHAFFAHAVKFPVDDAGIRLNV